MHAADCFVDTNVLLYAHDRDAKAKHGIARELVTEFWNQDTMPSLSVQVLQELFVNLTKKGVSLKAATDVVRDYSTWRVEENTTELLEAGIEAMKRWQTSFWDGLIVAAANASGASILLSEDLNSGQKYGNVIVRNPFL